MTEQVDLTVPITPPTSSSYTVVSILFDKRGSHIEARLVDNTGKDAVFTYDGIVATNLMIALNKANMATISLEKRIFNQLIADGKLSGTVSGVPA